MGVLVAKVEFVTEVCTRLVPYPIRRGDRALIVQLGFVESAIQTAMKVGGTLFAVFLYGRLLLFAHPGLAAFMAFLHGTSLGTAMRRALPL